MAAAFGLHQHSFTLVVHKCWNETSFLILVRCFSVHRIAAAVGLVGFDQLREFRADESRRAGFDHEWLHVLTFLCSFWVYVLDEGSYFPFCSCNNWMLNLYLQLFLGLLWPFSYQVWILLLAYGTRAVLRGLFAKVGTVQISLSLVFNTKKISLHAQEQFHAKYPLFDSQSDREFTFSYAIHS